MHPPGVIPDRTILAVGLQHVTDTLELLQGAIQGQYPLFHTLTVPKCQVPHVLHHSTQDP